MRPATPADIPAITAFLTARSAQAMFPLNNLALHGMAGGHPRAMRFWLAGDPLSGVLGLTDAGMIMPNILPDQVPAATRTLAGQTVFGLVGPAECAVPLFRALGLHDRPTQMAQVEPHFLLDLSAMVLPDTQGMALTPIGDAPRALMLDWSVDYDVGTLGARPDAAMAQAPGILDNWIAAGSHVVLWHDGQPVARTGFNAQCPGIVQIGGVYVPPPLRGRGYARTAVALHLAQAASRGVTQATLFSASDMAARAYRAIGFHQIGDWFLGLLDGTVTLPDG